MEGVGLIHSEGDNLLRCLRQISKSYNSQLHPKVNRKLVRITEDRKK